MKRFQALTLIAVVGFMAACNFPTSPPTSAVSEESPVFSPGPTQTRTPGEARQTAVVPTSTRAAEYTPTDPSEPSRPEEAILILEPGNGSRLISPAHVAGVADPTFEQHLIVRVVDLEGTELALQPVIIDADLGQRGPFEVLVPFAVSGERQAFIQVYDVSARDGGVVHLSSVAVTLAASGAESILLGEPQPERITIFEPAPGEEIHGGVVHVVGFGLGGFEQTLIVDVLDIGGAVVGSIPITVQAPDLGLPGPFRADVPYVLAEAGPGRISVRDVSPAFGGDVHVSSVAVKLAP
jgi:hypothetical protein